MAIIIIIIIITIIIITIIIITIITIIITAIIVITIIVVMMMIIIGCWSLLAIPVGLLLAHCRSPVGLLPAYRMVHRWTTGPRVILKAPV